VFKAVNSWKQKTPNDRTTGSSANVGAVSRFPLHFYGGTRDKTKISVSSAPL